ncbi:MAG: hypothetical protein GPOALKHO_000503 [Sodalis sp.]|nr:MAG: hypothetical protein GPOALKHO_000503 [Sodalis sp.]
MGFAMTSVVIPSFVLAPLLELSQHAQMDDVFRSDHLFYFHLVSFILCQFKKVS